jgi:uncharacterized integral membrane protein
MSVIRILKVAFFMAVLLLLVVMGMYNRGTVDFQLPLLLHQEVRQPAALMYFGFFAVGVLTGTFAALGGKSAGAKPKENKAS